MRLDLRDIINIPGTGVAFDYEPDLSESGYGSVKNVRDTRASGRIRNSAGVLLFSADARLLYNLTNSLYLEITRLNSSVRSALLRDF
jgi:hypothetical protein